MKKFSTFILAMITLLAVSIVFCSCDKTESGDSSDTAQTVDFLRIETVYAYAAEAGYTGTLEELIEAFKGDSAYAVAVKNGYTGTEKEWLAYLKGAAGKDGLTPYIGENGNWFIGETDTGVKAQGEKGNDGKSAYEIYKEKIGYAGTEEEWLDDLMNDNLGNEKEYTVTFNSNGGTECAEQKVKSGNSLTSLPVTERYGYTFEGWYYEYLGSLYSGIPLYILRDLTLNAAWTANRYTVSCDFACDINLLDKSDTYDEYKNISVYFDESIILPTPGRGGYSFDGWYYNDKKCENNKWIHTVSENVTLTAKWTKASTLSLDEIDESIVYCIDPASFFAASIVDGNLRVKYKKDQNELSKVDTTIPIHNLGDKKYLIKSSESYGLLYGEDITFEILSANSLYGTILCDNDTMFFTRLFTKSEVDELRSTDLSGNYEVKTNLTSGTTLSISEQGEISLTLFGTTIISVVLKIDNKYYIVCDISILYSECSTVESGQLYILAALYVFSVDDAGIVIGTPINSIVADEDEVIYLYKQTN